MPRAARLPALRTPAGYRSALVSDLPGMAQLQDTNLLNAWGVTFSGTGPFWVSDNAAGKATLYAVTNVPNGVDTVSKQTLEVTIPGGAPTGVVGNNKGGFNGVRGPDFQIASLRAAYQFRLPHNAQKIRAYVPLPDFDQRTPFYGASRFT